jgi:hypothetical protein
MRDKRRGVLPRLIEARLLAEPLAEEVAELYGVLNGAVHASAAALVHRGLYTGQYMGHVFRYEDSRLWTDLLTRSVRVGAELLSINIRQQEQLPASDRFICDVCHGDDWESEGIEEFGGQSYQRVRCSRCGRQLTMGMQQDEQGESSG